MSCEWATIKLSKTSRTVWNQYGHHLCYSNTKSISYRFQSTIFCQLIGDFSHRRLNTLSTTLTAFIISSRDIGTGSAFSVTEHVGLSNMAKWQDCAIVYVFEQANLWYVLQTNLFVITLGKCMGMAVMGQYWAWNTVVGAEMGTR